MVQTLTAGSAVIFFVIALVAFLGGADRISGYGVLAGLVAQAVAMAAHVSERRNG
jgi:hypothetical protein